MATRTITDPAEWVEGCRGRRIEEVVARCRELLEDPDFPTVAHWREQGGRVLGHFQVYFPEEIAHACGMLPVRVRGGAADGVEASQHFGSYLCSILKTSLDLALARRIELDLFVSHPICDGARNLAGIWGRNFPYKSQVLHLPQNPNTAAAFPFLAAEYRRLARDIAAAGGRPLDDDALRASLALYNRSRAQMRELYRLRRESPAKLSAQESAVLVGVAGVLPREQHVRLLEELLPRITARPAREQDKMRVVFEGGFCEVPPYDLLQAVARSCYVVDDDVWIGLRWLNSDVPTGGDPVANLAAAYIDRSSYSPVQHDNRKPREKMLLQRVRAARAEAVILAAAKMCEPGLDEQVGYAKALEHEGIPYFITEFEENQTTFDDISIQMETFVENILFA
ncbi:MAG: 2-hydroxyacyl-CoA dehydratase [Rubrivivax sp.]|jgi:benzoyl-CoA reductase subunit C|nr:2-hydroxyacyl-CoA dehydratase [Rubrivivax sp.]MCL4696586.1 2-hydroxyacyl-CoA dehydratase [Burkholderiaceae bacterium]